MAGDQADLRTRADEEKGESPPRSQRAGSWPVQLRHHTTLTSAQYVNEKGWLQASLSHCPCHPQGGCRFSRHGTYSRVEPKGMQVARCYCAGAHMTFSLLPDCLCSGLSGSLDETEQVVVKVEESSSLEAAASALRLDIELPGAVRWIRRRVQGVHTSLVALLTAMPEQLGSQAQVRSVRRALDSERVLVTLRDIGAAYLQTLPRPLGFRPLCARVKQDEVRFQHTTGRDPPRRSE